MGSLHIYRPLAWQERLGYSVAMTLRSGKPRCRVAVHGGQGMGFHQCNKPGHVEAEGVWVCRIHDPEAQASRDRAASEKYEAEDRKRRIEWSARRFMAALQQIADGHNDPRALALEALGEFARRPDADTSGTNDQSREEQNPSASPKEVK